MKKYTYFDNKPLDSDIKIIDDNIPLHSQKTNIIDEIVKYLGDPILTKIQNNYNSSNPIGIYQTKVSSNLCNENRYIIAMVKEIKGLEMPVGTTLRLSKINWANLQTRTSKNESSLCDKNTTFTPSIKLNYTFRLKERTDKKTIYSNPDFNILVELINKTKFDYADVIRLDGAIDSFNCSIIRQD